MKYQSLFAESPNIENSFDQTSRVGLMIADSCASESGDPLDALIELEEQLMEEHDMTFLQAIKAGIVTKHH